MLKLMLQQRLVGDNRLFIKALRLKHSSSEVRSQFLDFFQDHGHKFVQSSPVLPYNDPSLVFVNAGMNQFKSVLQNEREPPAPRVVNSQRCIRVGGKHNDLSQVGSDGSHLTMFEMLGSWSFKDYWKEEACSMAWHLMTHHFRLDPGRLYVTYFKGCEKSGLPPDKEVREIWLKLGVPENHILPFGMEDNFWEMGASGPCGPSTEIHYDFSGRGPDLVNAGTSENIEIWNLVFVQYNRLMSGDLIALSDRHIDTGMGLERLVALLNNSNSSFDSDLFHPLFQAISELSMKPPYSGRFGEGSELDTAYRILADHIRMIVVCLGDQVFPDQNHKLKFVLRRAFNIANSTFQTPGGSLKELSNYVIESLGDAFPSLQHRDHTIKTILEFEEENFNKFMDRNRKNIQLLIKNYPEEAKQVDEIEATFFYESLRLLDKENVTERLEPSLAYKLYESHGMQEHDIIKLSNLRNIQFDQDEFKNYFTLKKELSKLSTSQVQDMRKVLAESSRIPDTLDTFKYTYTRNVDGEYEFPAVDASLVMIAAAGHLTHHLNKGEEGMLFLDKTCFYGEAGGQVGDKGIIMTQKGAKFTVTNTQLVEGGRLVAHIGTVEEGLLTVGDAVVAKIDPEHREGCMRNHSATHVLNSVLHSLLAITSQKSSLVTPDFLRFEFSVYNTVTDLEFLRKVEEGVLSIINSHTQITSSTVSNTALEQINDLVTLPGEVYPEEVTLVDIGTQREPCCGTHLHNTADINSFVIVGFKTASGGVKSLRCLTGHQAQLARNLGVSVCEKILQYQEQIEGNCEDLDQETINELQAKINGWKQSISDAKFPALLNLELGQVLEAYRQRILLSTRSLAKQKWRSQIDAALEEQSSSKFFIHMLHVPKGGKINLGSLCKSIKKPNLILLILDGEVRGKTFVDQEFVTEDFNAELWLAPICEYLGKQPTKKKGVNKLVHCSLTCRKADPEGLMAALEKARQLANQHLK